MSKFWVNYVASMVSALNHVQVTVHLRITRIPTKVLLSLLFTVVWNEWSFLSLTLKTALKVIYKGRLVTNNLAVHKGLFFLIELFELWLLTAKVFNRLEVTKCRHWSRAPPFTKCYTRSKSSFFSKWDTTN